MAWHSPKVLSLPSPLICNNVSFQMWFNMSLLYYFLPVSEARDNFDVGATTVHPKPQGSSSSMHGSLENTCTVQKLVSKKIIMPYKKDWKKTKDRLLLRCFFKPENILNIEIHWDDKVSDRLPYLPYKMISFWLAIKVG